MTFTFAQVFLAALCFYFLVHSFTCLAEIIHLKRTIHEVPEPLRKKITPAQHMKAAHYDIARTKLNWLEVTVTTTLIVYLTAGNGINTISDWLMNTVGDQFAFHWMLPASIGFIFVLVDFPFCWYKEFRLREAFGYTQQTPSSWFKNYFLITLLGWLTVLPILWIGLFLWQSSGASWWILGWAIFAVYLIFALNLAHRLLYFFKPSRAHLAQNDELKALIDTLGEKAGLTVGEIRVTRSSDNEALPPAFAFGHRQNVRLFFRHDIYERMTLSNLQAIAAHALSRNLSHMYFQAWFMCALAGFCVFAFLAWFAPQSWFLDEIGFQVYGPGPYYGSVLTFTIVALPVLLFPFKLPMDAFLRHLIFASDTFAMKYTGLKVTVHSLIELFPTPMRHSSVTLGFFDLLFSHEPSLIARIRHVEKKSHEIDLKRQEESQRNDSLTVLHQLENVSSALASKQEYEVMEAEARDKRRLELNRRFETALVQRARFDPTAKAGLPLNGYEDPEYENALSELSASNTTHPMYGKSIFEGFISIFSQLSHRRRDHKTDGQNVAIQNNTDPQTPAEKQQDVLSVEQYAVQSLDPVEPPANQIRKLVASTMGNHQEKTSLDLSTGSQKSSSLPIQKMAHNHAEPSKGQTTEAQFPLRSTHEHAVFDVLDVKDNVSSRPTGKLIEKFQPEGSEKKTSKTSEQTQKTFTVEAKENAKAITGPAIGIKSTKTRKNKKRSKQTSPASVPPLDKTARRTPALKIMAHRHRELYAKTHKDAS